MKQVKFTTEVTPESASVDGPPASDLPNVNPTPKPINNSHTPSTNMTKKSKNPLSLVVISLMVVIAGIASGYLISTATAGDQSNTTVPTTSADGSIQIEEGETYGAENGESFTDEAKGVLVAGGVSGEGSHHLMRPGGPSQNVYLTSSVINLDQFENAEVEVWGETFAAQQAGWLMDVGKVKVIKLNAEKPFEESEE